MIRSQLFIVFILVLWNKLPAVGIPPPEGQSIAPRVYLDVDRREVDVDYIKSEITFVNYVRDRQDAEIHLLITRRRTGSGGHEYNCKFIGLKKYEGEDSELKFYSKSIDTKDQSRSGLVKVIKQGLIPYISDTPMSEFISISYEDKGREVAPREPGDRWNHWAFRVGLDGELSSQDLEKAYEYSLFLSAARITEVSKIRLWAFRNDEKATYTVENEAGDLEDFVSRIKRQMVFASYIKSLGGHWSAGGFFDYFSSDYDNAQAYYTFGAGIEYNIFPYSDYTSRELRIQYRLEYSIRNYFETTIYDLLDENLLRQKLVVLLTVKEPWGSMAFQLTGLAYLHDLSKNNIRADTEIRVNVLKGLSVDLVAGYSRVRDQLSLPKEGATKDEVLLNLQELATGYDLSVSLGISYRFGSLYSNIVNPRFDVPRRHR